MQILVIEDDAELHNFLSTFLRAEGFDVFAAYTGVVGLQLLSKHTPDLVIVDIQLPHIDGWEVCKRIRSYSNVPIIIMTATARHDRDVVHGLDIGADDYLLKPIRPSVLRARVTAVLRRSKNGHNGHKQIGFVDPFLTVDVSRQQVQVQGQRQSLSSLEYNLLELLVVNMGQTVPMLEIIHELWSDRVEDSYDRYVRIYVRRLREIIEPKPDTPRYIITDYGLGYRFDPDTVI